MEYTSKTVRSRPGLSQEQALDSLQESSLFRPGTRIASIKPNAGRWVAQLLIPKTSDFPPPSGGEDPEAGPPKPPKDEGDDEGPDDDVGDEGPPSDGPPGEDKKPKGDKPGSDTQVVDILTQILHALQGGPPMDGMGGPDDLGPGAGGPPAPPPHGGPPGGPAAPPPGAGRPMKPGEIPNKPGLTPIGSPAFSHTRQANPLAVPPVGGMPGGAPPAGPGSVSPGPTSQGGTGACAGCGQPLGPNGQCATCGGSYKASLSDKIAKVAGTLPSFTVSAHENMSIKEAKAELEAAAKPYGYSVKQIRRVDGRPRALLSIR